MKTIVRGSLLAAVLPVLGWVAYHKGFGPQLGAPPSALKSAHHTEEEWLAGEVVRDVAEMVTYARREGAGSDLRVSLAPTGGGGWAAQVRFGAAEVRQPVATTGVWTPSDYVALGRALVRQPGLAPASKQGDTAVLARLTDLRATVIAREARRVSESLAAGMANPSVHEEAALVLAAFALREAAGTFTDHRPALCRITAHLALASALREGGAPTRAGAYAEATLLALSGRGAQALVRLDELAPRAGTLPGASAWDRALRLRVTADWRPYDPGAGRSLLERLEYLSALKRTGNPSLALDFLERAGTEPVADWGRIMTGSGFVSVEEGNRFVMSALQVEEAEIQEVRAAIGAEPLVGTRLVEALNAPPSRCMADGRPQVLGPDSWAAFAQRQVVNRVRSIDHHLRRMLGLPKEADAAQRALDAQWGGLELFPVAACWRTRGKEQNLDRLQDAIDVTIAYPERVTAYNWLHLEASAPFEALRRGMPRAAGWFATGFPRGTVYDTAGRLGYTEGTLSTITGGAAALETLTALDPYDPVLPRRRSTVRSRREPATAEAMLALFGPRAAYDQGMLAWIREAVAHDPAQVRAVLSRQCALDPNVCPDLAWQLWSAGERRAAIEAYERAAAAPNVDHVALSGHAGWVSRYYLEAGNKQRALQVARGAAETGSGAGLYAMASLLERLGRFPEAEEYYAMAAERYDQPGPLIAFHYRMARGRHVEAYEPKLQASLPRLFPRGLERANASTLAAAPEDGVFVNGWTQEMLEQDVRAGDVIVALDGWRTRTAKQYTTVRDFPLTDTDEMTLTIWRGGYREARVRFKDRRMGIDIVDYPQKGWVGQ